MLQDQLEERGYGVVLTVTGNEPQRERDAIARLVSAPVDGIVIVPTLLRNPPDAGPLPVVELNRLSSRKVDKVTYGEREGAKALTAHLVELGHTRIGFIGGPSTLSTGHNRIEGYRAALEAGGIAADPELERLRAFTPEWGESSLRYFAGLDDAPSAIVSTSSELTLGALRAAKDLGINLPDEISIAAFGNPDWYDLVTPRITRYDQPIGQCASIAVQMLANRLSGLTSDAPTRVLVAGEVVLRESVADKR